MTLRRAALRPFALPLVRPLATAHGPIALRLGWVVELEDESGRRGFGEATPLPGFGSEDLARCRDALERALRAGMRRMRETRVSFDESAPCATSAIDSARFDLAARRADQALADRVRDLAGLPGPARSSVAVQALIGGASPDDVAESAAAAIAAGYRAFKLKLAVSREQRDLGLDLDRVARLRAVVGPAARVRLDANEAWDRAQAAVALAALAAFDIDYVEQPVVREDLDGLAQLARDAAIDVAADEALQGEGLERCLAARAARVLIVKPSLLGGIGRAIDLERRARGAGLRVVWSTLVDGAVGRAAAVALAAALGDADEVHGLGTGGLLAADLADPSLGDRLDADGRLLRPPGPGIGFDPSLPRARPSSDERLQSHLRSGLEMAL